MLPGGGGGGGGMTEKSREEDRRHTFHLTPFPRFRNSSRADSGSKGWIRALNRRDNYVLPVYFNFVSRLTGYGYGQVYVAPLKASFPSFDYVAR